VTERWTGAVLTGGASTRMGTDKALLEVAGEPMAVRVARALRTAGATGVVCIGGDDDALAALGLAVVPDEHPGEGPLGALITALGASAHPVVVVAPCDLLAPDPAVATALRAALRAEPEADAAVAVVDGVRQPLDGAYRRTCRPRLVEVFTRGERSVRRALLELLVVEVTIPGADALRDADTPEDLRADR
jgi:molybdopterin-guanine dinucleotide biosynthesis protein A